MRRGQMDGDTEMTEETAVRIAEALESISKDTEAGVILFFCFAVAFWVIAVFKN